MRPASNAGQQQTRLDDMRPPPCVTRPAPSIATSWNGYSWTQPRSELRVWGAHGPLCIGGAVLRRWTVPRLPVGVWCVGSAAMYVHTKRLVSGDAVCVFVLSN